MSVRVGSLGSKFLTEMGIPIIFYLVIGSTGKPTGDEGPSVAKQGVHSDDEIIFIGSYVSSLDVWS